jgi:hypothetical protein
VTVFARALVAAIALLAFAAAPAVAQPPDATIGITLDPIAGGIHESFNDRIHLPPIPVPVLEASYRVGSFELTGYGLPPTIALPYTDAIQGPTGVRLTILDGTFRVWDNAHRLGVGVGETIYNQTTNYALADFFGTSGGERQYSRLVGAHYEIVARFPFLAGTLETSLRYAPVMLGTQVSTYDNGATPTRFDPERGEQIDGSIRYVRHISRHGDAVIGVRYVNFTAAYDVPLRPLSDRNAAVLPAIGYLWRP